ncbi:uncharacterized protein K444DRAFT_591626 [Hyaloscypha bicolor E]|uniref:NACHT domain-containing protein n=1 Tax=Hyaloscypha bicolor E TaxID=1095630 RepID=A0A2J6T5R2_9HELO|nr:uncharacterized protein K444DRAFT_591626 [Hyaloscypha bicolor E]PMD58358.1 hypothetical protein K444DRAFT_591626 [Hyaloscypha bicolor E]
MVDPFTAISITNGLLALCDRAIQCGKIVKKLHDLGATDEHKELEETADKMEIVVKELNSAQIMAKHQMSKTDLEVATVIGKMKTTCVNLREVLRECKAQKGSLRSAISATLRTMLKSSDITKFQKELEGYRTKLETLLLATISERVIDMVDRLEDLKTQMSHEVYSIKRNLERNLEELDDSIKNAGGDLGQKIESLKAAFQEAQDVIRRKLILEALWFPGIDTRFRTIGNAEPNTFGWIYKNPDKLREMQRDLDLTFTEWLERGSGIFHIAGKAGSGKSTLMKYLCDGDEDREAEMLLHGWAASRSKTPIFCKFFFYRVTSVEQQKTWKGLIHSLLHSVLQQVPTLAPRLFPRQWEQRRDMVQDISHLELGDREINKAFEILLTDRGILGEYCICFFIDGLDEFEQRNQTHYRLACDLQKWANDSKGDVKMCVSSRPLPEFLNVFPTSQRIMLQNLTKDDIETLVINKLVNNPYFTRMMQGSKEMRERCIALRDKVFAEANGIFLWVGMILNQIEIALAEGDSVDVMDVMERIVRESSDKDLDSFFKTIVESVPAHHRTGSYYLLAGAMRMSGLLISASKTKVELRILEDILLPVSKEQFLTLEHSELVFDLADKNKHLAFDSDVLTNAPHRLRRSRAVRENRLSIRCRGLVEVDDNGLIRFTHRAIPESLQHYLSKHAAEVGLSDGRVAEMLTWLVLADSSSPPERRIITTPYLLHRLRECDLIGHEKIFHLLRRIDVELGLAQLDPQWTTEILHHFQTNLHPTGRIVDVFRQCQILGIHEYLDWALNNYLNLPKDKSRIHTILTDLLFTVGAKKSYVRSRSAEFLASKLVDIGLTFETAGLSTDGTSKQYNVGCPAWIWYQFLAREVFFQATSHAWRQYPGYNDYEKHFNWKGIEIMLKLGADPQVWLAEAGEWEKGVLTGADGEVLYSISPNDFFFYYEPEFVRLRYGKSRISLVDFIKTHHPPNCKELLGLIRDNLKDRDHVTRGSEDS